MYCTHLQPVVDFDGNVLVWNGEVFGSRRSDTDWVVEKLHAADYNRSAVSNENGTFHTVDKRVLSINKLKNYV